MSDATLIAELMQQNTLLNEQVTALKRQLDWFQRQLFGRKSEQRLEFDPEVQQDLLSGLGVPAAALPPLPVPTEAVTYQRKKLRNNSVNEVGLRFADHVPVHEILLDGMLVDKFV